MSYKKLIRDIVTEDYIGKVTLDLYGEEGPDDKLFITRVATGIKNMFGGLGHDDRMAKDVFDKMKDYKRYFTELKDRHNKSQQKTEAIRDSKLLKKLAIYNAMGHDELSVNSLTDFIMDPYKMLVEDGTVDIVIDWLMDMRTMSPRLKNNGMLDDIRKMRIAHVQEWVPENAIFAMPTKYIGTNTIILCIRPIDKHIHETLMRSTTLNIAEGIRKAGNVALRTDGYKYDNQETGKLSLDAVSFESITIPNEYYTDIAYKTLSHSDAESLLDLGLEICDLEYKLRKKLDTLEKALSNIDPTNLKEVWKIWKAYKFTYTFPKLRNFIRGNTYHLADSLALIKDIYLACTESEDNHKGMGIEDPEADNSESITDKIKNTVKGLAGKATEGVNNDKKANKRIDID